MSGLNPYEKFLTGRPVVETLGATAAQIELLLEAMGARRAAMKPAPEKWSAAEIVSHLADCELVFGYRMRQTLAEDAHVIQPFDQDKWAVQYGGIAAGQALEVFRALREWNLPLIRRAMPAAAGLRVTHPERGELTLGVLVETQAGHDLNHLAQLQRIAAAGRPTAL
jgi:hypothetical protein